ncbi:hypothetical protein IFM89_034494 [Coptis chinensis]|uniref:beta-aspartyl-peptidase n=1 Tax=Coptis chinensis TaxID=261450 RepID=A0A835LXL0_9MAGN|nr:hypothetical protein IFM89_034494 [Coptis chinensis]
MGLLRNLLVTSLLLISSLSLVYGHAGKYPLVVSTWPFIDAVRAGWQAAQNGFSAVDSVVEGCSACEVLRCDVGPGGSPDENGETTLDALVMDGTTTEVGAVAAMRYVKDGIRAAKLVMRHTKHTLLVGEKASAFAISMGLPGPTNLSSPESIEKWIKWKDNGCEPNYWKNVLPANSCGPYHPKDPPSSVEGACSMGSGPYHPKDLSSSVEGACSMGSKDPIASSSPHISHKNHDTISMAVIDQMGHIAVGTSTNGATFKIPGRLPVFFLRFLVFHIVSSNFWSFCMASIALEFHASCVLFEESIARRISVSWDGVHYEMLVPRSSWIIELNFRVGDGPIAGSSAYADTEVGACGATGDGDVMMRFLPCYQVVESMRLGMSPKLAAKDAILRIARKYPDFVGAIFAVDKTGIHAGACHGWTFQYSVRSPGMEDVEVFTVLP